MNPRKTELVTKPVQFQQEAYKMLLENYSEFPSPFLEEVAAPDDADLPEFDMRMADSDDDSSSGVCYPCGVRWNRPERNKPFISIRIAKQGQGIVGETSFSVVLPKQIATEAGIRKGDYLEFFRDGNRIVLQKAGTQIH
jgi:hypothetical protein